MSFWKRFTQLNQKKKKEKAKKPKSKIHHFMHFICGSDRRWIRQKVRGVGSDCERAGRLLYCGKNDIPLPNETPTAKKYP